MRIELATAKTYLLMAKLLKDNGVDGSHYLLAAKDSIVGVLKHGPVGVVKSEEETVITQIMKEAA